MREVALEVGFGELTGGASMRWTGVWGGWGRHLELRGVTGKGWENRMSRLAGAWSPVWELERVRLDRSLGPNRELEYPSVSSVKAFQMMVRVGV